MKRFLLFFLVFFSLQNAFAQLDREHWFAPMFDGQSNGSPLQYLYLSTNETTSFPVYIYSNNVLISQTTIRKGLPAAISIPRNYIITDNVSDLHKVRTMGLYVKGDRPFFANFRFEVTNHAEIITSKGTSGIGTKFYTVVTPNSLTNSSFSNLGFAASFLATENNTTVTVNNFKKVLNFNNYGTATSFTFTLNKGESYIIDGRSSNSNNQDGFIGATVTSDKPISMSNGNFNGQFSINANDSSGSDIFMDQSVPTDKLGDEFVIVKGYGAIGNNMEGAIVVATENNTEIYLNDLLVPSAVLANPGDYYVVKESNYILRGSSHYNLRIRTSKNVYVYQFLGGVEVGSSPLATGGMNYIPPLNCYLPRKIDELSDINRIGTRTFNTKLNIITEKGANVTVNGVVPNALYGPYDISTNPSNQNWVTYSIPNVSGNQTVVSDKAVTAGIAGGTAAFGFGGYFAGFSNIPAIIKQNGECLPGVTLSVTEGFNHYLWLLKDASGNYNPAPGINNLNTYEPTQAGIYAVEIQQGSCPQIQTQDYKFYNCTTYTNTNHDICTTKTITPQFALSSQPLNPASVNIVTQPTKGTVVKNADGTITYTANLNATGADTFKFSFCGVGAIPDCETVQATINLNQVEHYNVTLNECSTNGTATYNLSNAAVTPDTSTTKTYYQTLNGAQNQIVAEVIGNFTSFTTTDRFVYVRITNSFGCFAIAQIELKSLLAPAVNPNLYTTKHCDEDVDGIIDGVYKLDLTTITPTVLQNATSFIVKYYDNLTDANNDASNNITGIFTFTGNTSVWIRVNTTNGCPSVVREIPLQIGNKVLLIANNITEKVCDNDGNGSQSINLNDYTPLFYSGAATATFYNTLANAQNNTNAIAATQNLTGNRTIYYRIKVSGFCDEIGILNLELNAGTPSTQLLANYAICEGNTQTLDPGTGYTSYTWSTGATSQTINVSAGTYWVDLTNANGCTYRQSVTVTEELKAQLNAAAYNGANCDTDFNGIINVKFSTQVTPVILPSATGFTVTYSTDPTFATTLPDNWTYSTPTVVYVKVQGSVCPPIVQQINFGFGNNVPLIANTSTNGVCDNDLNGSQTVNLATYVSQFYSGTGATVRYFETLANAQSNTGNVAASQTLTGNKTFYLRIKVANYCDVIVTLNLELNSSTPSTQLLANYAICEGNTQTLDPGTGYTSYNWSTGATSQTINVSAGTYWVDLTNANGCTYRQSVTVTEELKAQLNAAAYNGANCDTDFNGIINVKFSTQVTPVILPSATGFTVTYSTDPTFATTLPDNWTYSTPTVVYVKVQGSVCPPIVQQINFGFGNNVPLIANTSTNGVCDNDLNGSQTVNLATYVSQFYSGTGATVRYFETLANAQSNTGNVAASQTLTGNKTFYLRIKVANYCDVIVTLNLELNSSTPSTQLLANYAICEGNTQTLDPGTGYTSYNWSTGATSQTINVSAGTYWVDLTNANGCTYRQSVTVTEELKAQLNAAAYNGANCDTDFNGIINVKFSTQVTPVILPSATGFTVTYSTDPTFATTLPDNWTYSTPTVVYVKVQGSVCPPIVQQINFGFGNNVPLIANTSTNGVCDNDLNGSQTVNLATYVSQFYSGTGATVRYFETLANAQSNTGNVAASQTLTGNKTFYLRIKVANYCDVIVTLNLELNSSTPSTQLLPSYTICQTGATQTLDPGSGYTAYRWSNNATTQTITVGPGNYWVNLTNAHGCVYRQNVTVVGFPVAQLNVAAYNGIKCDENFDGQIDVQFSTEVTPVVLTNSANYTVRYYTTQAFADAGGNNNLADNWSYSTATTLYIRVDSPYCPYITKTINFGFGNKVTLLNQTQQVSVCDDDLDGIKDVDLSNYKSLFTTDASVVATYFATQQDANDNINPLTNPVTTSGTKSFFIRFSKNNLCTAIGELVLTVKTPRESTTLQDLVICPDTTTLLDAGSGFDSYVWSTGDTTQTITAGAGDYWVDLTYNGCVYRQSLTITEFELPQIVSIDIAGTTVTINVTGGTPPYRYSLDGISYQDSNIFNNVPAGQNTAYVISADQCAPVTQTFVVIRLLNVITPNGDGLNDKLNYSDLLYKEDVLLKIYDRNGALIFTGDKSNNYTWDGKINGRPVATASYWYILQWKDPGAVSMMKFSGWVLVKSRE